MKKSYGARVLSPIHRLRTRQDNEGHMRGEHRISSFQGANVVARMGVWVGYRVLQRRSTAETALCIIIGGSTLSNRQTNKAEKVQLASNTSCPGL